MDTDKVDYGSGAQAYLPQSRYSSCMLYYKDEEGVDYVYMYGGKGYLHYYGEENQHEAFT